ncbi:unnamed protein product, partial [Prorocentrum cordatum]
PPPPPPPAALRPPAPRAVAGPLRGRLEAGGGGGDAHPDGRRRLQLGGARGGAGGARARGRAVRGVRRAVRASAGPGPPREELPPPRRGGEGARPAVVGQRTGGALRARRRRVGPDGRQLDTPRVRPQCTARHPFPCSRQPKEAPERVPARQTASRER